MREGSRKKVSDRVDRTQQDLSRYSIFRVWYELQTNPVRIELQDILSHLEFLSE